MTTVKIYVIGLIAIWSTDQATTLVLRDVPNRDYINGACVEPHIPLLWWVARCQGACDSGGSRTFKRCDNSLDRVVERKNLWLLNGEELALSGSFRGGTRAATRRIAQISRLVDHPDSGSFDPDKLDDPVGNRIVASWRLDGVSAEACHLAAVPAGVARFRFFRGGSSKPDLQPLADVALVQFTVSSLPLTLTATSSDSTRSVELSPDGDNPITLVLSNQTPKLSQRRLTGWHFDYLYEYSKRPPASARRFVPRVSGFDPRLKQYVNACGGSTIDPILEEIVRGHTPALLGRSPRALVGDLLSLGSRPTCPLGEY